MSTETNDKNIKNRRRILDVLIVVFLSLLFKFILINLPVSVTILAPIDVVTTLLLFYVVTNRVKYNYGKKAKKTKK